MERKLEVNTKVNNWTVIEGPFKNEKECDCFKMKCNCGKIETFQRKYINRSTFSKSCRKCSQNKRLDNKKVIVGNIYKNFTVLDSSYKEGTNYYYPVKCKCGNITKISAARLLSKRRVEMCEKCYNANLRSAKSSKMYTNNISKTYYEMLYRQARLRGIDFKVSPEYLENLYILQNKKCKLSGILLYMGVSFSSKKNRDKHTASLDRINSNLGYIEDNLQWVHKDVNYMKNDFEEKYFIELCEKIYKNANLEPSTMNEYKSSSEGAETTEVMNSTNNPLQEYATS